MNVKIAVVQFEINQYEPDYNLMKAEKFIAKAADSKADIIVFPEDFITGPIGLRLEEFADNSQKYCKYFQNLAKKYKINIVPGSIIEKEKLGIYNTSYYIDSKGEVKGKYKKSIYGIQKNDILIEVMKSVSLIQNLVKLG